MPQERKNTEETEPHKERLNVKVLKNIYIGRNYKKIK